jgi:hypothetical protein
MQTTIDWLLSGPSYVERAAPLGLLGERGSAKVRDAHRRMVASPEVRALVKELHGWPVAPLNGHKSAGRAIRKLTFLADLGLTRDDAGIDAIARWVVAHVSSDGPSQVWGVVGPACGGTGKETWSGTLCDAQLLV